MKLCERINQTIWKKQFLVVSSHCKNDVSVASKKNAQNSGEMGCAAPDDGLGCGAVGFLGGFFWGLIITLW